MVSKRIWIILICTGFLYPGGIREKQKIEMTFQNFSHAWSMYDAEKARNCITEDYVLIQDCCTYNWESITKQMKEMKNKGIEFSFEVNEFNTNVVGNVAYSYFSTNGSFIDSGLEKELIQMHMVIFIKVDTKWKIDRQMLWESIK